MAGPSTKKRSHADSSASGKRQKPNKKQRRVLQYNSDSEEDLDNAFVDDVGRLSGSEAESDGERPAFNPATRKRMQQPEPTKAKKSPKKQNSIPEDKSDNQDGAGAESDDDDGDDNFDVDDNEEGDEVTDSEGETSNLAIRRPKSKRNDPDAFATSLQKILSTVRWRN
jgi:hypothetical protein